MKASQFKYARPKTVQEALELLDEYGDDARILAGGQSLGPMLNLRAASPSVVIDINRIAELSGITVSENSLRIGALTRHSEVERSPTIARHLKLISHAVPHIAHPAIRTRGTFGGSCALADPSAELPACCLALDATFIAMSVRGERRIKADHFFKGVFTTELRPDELLAAVEFPFASSSHRSAFGELARRLGDFAMAGVAMHARIKTGTIKNLRLVAFGVDDRPVRISSIETAVEGQKLTTSKIKDLLTQVETGLEPTSDIHSSAAAKKHYVRVLVARGLADLIGVEAPNFRTAIARPA